MREDRFFISSELKIGTLELAEKRIIHQLKNVLRKKAEEKIIFFDGKMKEGVAKIKKFLKDKIEFEVLEIKNNERESEIFVSLFCSILKKSNFELICQKATEIGAKEIFPLICKRTIKTGLNLKRLEKIILEAAEQSGRGILPKISAPINFESAVKMAKGFDLKVLFDILGEDFLKLENKFKKIALFVGPEGGWDEKEIKFAKKENFKILNLGKLTFRAETSAIVGVFLATNLLKKTKP